MPKFVNVRQINFRREPTVTPATLIGPLDLGQEVTDLGGAPPGWEHISVDVNGIPTAGYVVATTDALRANWERPKQPVLREAASPAREALVAAAVAQWKRFERGTGLEYEDPYAGYIGAMWRAIEPRSRLTGRDRQYPWSAVAISLMVRTAAQTFTGYQRFRQSIRHSDYIMDAIQSGVTQDVNAPFWAVRLPASRPQVGDIIANWRQNPDDARSDVTTFDEYLRGNPGRPSHTDIVVAVGPNLALAIGGNVSESVSITGYQLGDDGSLYPNPRRGATRVMGGAIAVMVNRVQ